MRGLARSLAASPRVLTQPHCCPLLPRPPEHHPHPSAIPSEHHSRLSTTPAWAPLPPAHHSRMGTTPLSVIPLSTTPTQ